MFKKKGTKITALILAAMMTASAFLSGCGGTDSAGSQNSAASDTKAVAETDGAKESADTNSGSKEKTKLTMVTYLGNPTRDAWCRNWWQALTILSLKSFLPRRIRRVRRFPQCFRQERKLIFWNWIPYRWSILPMVLLNL